MGKATLKGILARKLRLALTTLAVLLGVAFVSGTYVLTDTMERSFDTIFRRTVTDVDLVVRACDPYTGGGSQRTRIPDATLARVRAVDGVATADGTTFGYAQLVGHDGDSIQNGLVPTIGLSWPESDAGPLALAHDGKSRPPRGDREVLVDEGTARANGFKVGDRVRVLLQGPAQQFTIVGLFGLKGQADLGGVTVAAFDLPTSERALASDRARSTPSTSRPIPAPRRGPSHAISSRRSDRATRSSRRRSWPRSVPEPVRQRRRQPPLGVGRLRGRRARRRLVHHLQHVRDPHRATHARARLAPRPGASRAQVLGSVMLEAAIVGVVAAGLGLAAGVGLAALLLRAVGFARIGLGAPKRPRCC